MLNISEETLVYINARMLYFVVFYRFSNKYFERRTIKVNLTCNANMHTFIQNTFFIEINFQNRSRLS